MKKNLQLNSLTEILYSLVDKSSLSAFFGITPGLWMNLQLDYEFMRADREKGEAIRKEVQPCSA
jgi:plasmid maintenance system antidote protein VapI